MKTYIKKIGKNQYNIEEFESVLELTKIDEKRTVTEDWANHCLSESKVQGDSRWYGVSTIKEAYDLLSQGWQEGTEKALSISKNLKTIDRKKTNFVNNVQGFIPNVPLSLMNVPNSMIDVRPVQTKSKIVNIIYDNTASASVSSSDMIRAGVNLVNLIIDLEMSGYRCNVKCTTTSCQDGSVDICLVNVKNANQNLNLRKMMFPLAHSAWLRVIGFDWQDKSPIAKYKCSRGCPFYAYVNDGQAKLDDLKSIYGENTYFITYKQAINGKEALRDFLKMR